MTAMDVVSHAVAIGAGWIRLSLEALGALTIGVGMLATLAGVFRGARQGRIQYASARFTLARYLALALEFQLAADILETALSPTWQKIGELAAIATIRTALNYFLSRELASERLEMSPSASAGA